MTSTNQISDEQSVARLKVGDERAFEVLYRKYHRALYYLAFKYLNNRSLAEDAVQEVYIKLWLHRASLHEHLPVKGWLFTSMKNYVLNFIRDNKSTLLKYADLSGTIHASHQQTEDEVMLASFSVIAEAGISRLSAQKKRIFQMRTQCGLSNEEVATQLGISIGTVKVQFSQATKFLRDYLEKFAGISSALLGAVIKYLLS